MTPFLSCLCPTYCRPRLLENAIACFCEQDYPKDRCELVILDDAGQIREQSGNGWRVISVPDRFPSLPAKYNHLATLADPDVDAFVIWEDDDIYLPHHLAAHAAALQRGHWSKPSRVLSLYSGQPEIEPADGRFFASIAISRELWRHVGGLPATARADFDQQFLARLVQQGGPAADPLEDSPRCVPSYCFRWASTGAYHGQAQMRSPDDMSWYQRCRREPPVGAGPELFPQLDAEGRQFVLATLGVVEGF